MNNHSDVASLIDKIKQSKKKWIMEFPTTWTFAELIKKEYHGNLWETPLSYTLPAVQDEIYYFTPKELYENSTDRDADITINYTVTMFTLLEALIRDLSVYFDGKEIDSSKVEILVKYLLRKKFLFSEEESDFRMAKATRNCYVHYGKRISKNWMDIYKDHGHAIKRVNLAEPKDDLTPIVNYHVINKWHDMLLRITQRIEDHLNGGKKK